MQEYCNSLTKYSRFETREVRVGEIGVGGSNPYSNTIHDNY